MSRSIFSTRSVRCKELERDGASYYQYPSISLPPSPIQHTHTCTCIVCSEVEITRFSSVPVLNPQDCMIAHSWDTATSACLAVPCSAVWLAREPFGKNRYSMMLSAASSGCWGWRSHCSVTLCSVTSVTRKLDGGVGRTVVARREEREGEEGGAETKSGGGRRGR